MNISCAYCKYSRISHHYGYRCQLNDPSACLPCRNVASLDEKILKLRDEIIELEKERLMYKVQVNATHDELTTRMPLEILEAIFQFTVLEDVADLDLEVYEKERSCRLLCGPLTLSAVSQSWRNIAQSTPKLWMNVPLRLRESNQYLLPALADEWMKRSGKHPLSINILAHRRGDTKQAQDLIKVINKHCTRWRHLAFQGQSSNLSMFSSDIDALSQLQTLRLSIYDSRTMGKFNLGGFILRPTRLTLRSIFSLQAVKIDWTRLTELDLQKVSLQTCIEALQRTPLLIRCTLSPSANMSSNSPAVSPLLHQKLEDLTVLGNSWTSIFRSASRFPFLQKISVVAGGHPPQRISLMVDFILKSSCLLTTLSLTNVPFLETDLDILCRDTPTLRHLRLEYSAECSSVRRFHPFPEPTSRLLSLLSEPRRTGDASCSLYLPELCSLEIHQIDAFDWRLLPAIFGVSENTVRRRSELSSVRIDICGFTRLVHIPANVVSDMVIGKDVRGQLLALKASGKRLNIHLGIDGMDLI